MPAKPRILVVAGHDPSGRAGLLADAQTILSLGGQPCGCVTALTAQPQGGKVEIFPTSPQAFGAQLDAVLGDGPVAAVKVGMVTHPNLVQLVIERLTRLPPMPVVVDPVLATSTGTPLLIAGSRRATFRELARLRPVFTPNLPELGILTGQPTAKDDADEIRQSDLLLAWGASAVLVKGGHREGGVHDVLVTADGEEQVFRGSRLSTAARGRGCRLSSALATHLGNGLALPAAVERARDLVRRHLEAHST